MRFSLFDKNFFFFIFFRSSFGPRDFFGFGELLNREFRHRRQQITGIAESVANLDTAARLKSEVNNFLARVRDRITNEIRRRLRRQNVTDRIPECVVLAMEQYRPTGAIATRQLEVKESITRSE